jgi:hypothetical protein
VADRRLPNVELVRILAMVPPWSDGRYTRRIERGRKGQAEKDKQDRKGSMRQVDRTGRTGQAKLDQQSVSCSACSVYLSGASFPVLLVLFGLSFSASFVLRASLAFPFCLSSVACQFCLFCPVFFSSVLFCLSCCAYTMLTTLFFLSCSACPILSILFCLSYRGFLVLVFSPCCVRLCVFVFVCVGGGEMCVYI